MMIKKYLIGGATTMGLAFVPYSAAVAISVYAFGHYELKLGPFGTLMLAFLFAGMFAVAAFIGFTIAFPLLNRITHSQKIWFYLVTIAVPVGMIYLFAAIGFIKWLFYFVHPHTFTGNILVGVLAYLFGLVGTIGFAIIKIFKNKAMVG